MTGEKTVCGKTIDILLKWTRRKTEKNESRLNERDRSTVQYYKPRPPI